MRIISWNCSGAFRKKFPRIEILKPNLVIIQECENPEFYEENFQEFSLKSFHWKGEDKNKGIGIFCDNSLSVDLLNWDSQYSIVIPGFSSSSLHWNLKDLKSFVPFRINNSFNCIAVWTKGSQSSDFPYIGQFWKFLIASSRLWKPKETLFIGDFNSNSIWDKKGRFWNHSDIVENLEIFGIRSLYHSLLRENQGEETKPTFFMHRNKDKPYHIDYAFVPNELISSSSILVGNLNEWIDLSDHMPLICDINF